MNCPSAWNRVRQSGSLLRAQPGSLFASSGSNPGSAGKFPGSKKKRVTGEDSQCYTQRTWRCFIQMFFGAKVPMLSRISKRHRRRDRGAAAGPRDHRESRGEKKVVDERCEGT